MLLAMRLLLTNLQLCNYHFLFLVGLLHFYETAPTYVKLVINCLPIVRLIEVSFRGLH